MILWVMALQASTAAALPAAATPPTAKGYGNTISVADYPRAARREKAQGTTTIAYRIGTNGRVESCAASQSSGNAALDEATCGVVRRWRFNPARDAAGAKVPFDDSLTIAWRIAPSPCGKLPAGGICVTLD